MSGALSVSAASERVELDSTGRAEATFTVTNQGPIDQRLVFDVEPGETADQAWFNVVEPQVLVQHGGSATFLVRLAVPAGTAPGPGWFAGRVYSADRAPEETSVISDRVAFEIRQSSRPVPWWRKWWWVFVAAALLLVAIAVVLAFVLRDDSSTVYRSGQLVINMGGTADLDEVIVGGSNTEFDFDLQPGGGSGEWYITPANAAKLAQIGAAAEPVTACATATLSEDGIPNFGLVADDVICVRTSEGRQSVVTVLGPIGLGVTQLRISVTTYES